MKTEAESTITLPGDSCVPLESILCTEELESRPSRSPDYEHENRTLAALVQALADSPQTILQQTAEIMLKSFHAESAGFSLLTKDDGGKRFHWPAIAGLWKPHIGGGTPREFGPCGDVLDRNAPLLFKHWERRYPYLQAATPPIEEGLLVPFHVNGKAVGTIWVIAHSDHRKFDAEDLRQLVSLGKFASAAYQAVTFQGMVAMNEALVLGSLRQRELTEAAEKLNEQLRAEITQRQQTDAKLRASEERYRTLFASAPMAVFACDKNAVIQHYNQRAVELWGREPECGVEKHCGSLKLWLPNGTLLPHTQSPMVELLRTGVPARGVEVFIERPDGSRLPVLVNFAALKNEQGEITGSITSFMDITERKRAEEKMQEAQTLLANRAAELERLVAQRTAELRETVGELEAFSYSITHDLRAPLRAMQSFSHMLDVGYDDKLDDAGKDLLRRIRGSAHRMDKLIQDVLQYSQVLRVDLQMERVDADEFLREILESYPHFQEPQAEITIEGKLPAVIANEAALTQCISNLLNNAVKFVAPGVKPRVRIWAERRGETVRLWFEDNGIGIAAPYLGKIFEMFERLETSFEGTGIGLTIVRKTVERMGGQVGVESEPDKGSRFWIELKAATTQKGTHEPSGNSLR